MPDFPVPRFDQFYRHAELTRLLQRLCRGAARPGAAALASARATRAATSGWLTLTNTATGADTDKPAFWVDGNIHAAELTASTACLYWLHQLVSRLRHATPPGHAAAGHARGLHRAAPEPRRRRAGAGRPAAPHPLVGTRPYPFDEPPVDGLTVEDIDGDGRMLYDAHPRPARRLEEARRTSRG